MKLVFTYIRGVVKGEPRAMSPPLQFPNQTRSKNFSFKLQGCCFLRMFRNYTDQKSYNFYRVIFGQFMVAFHFFKLHRGNRSLHVGSSEKVRYLTLDLLESFFLWTIRRKTTTNESLNLRL